MTAVALAGAIVAPETPFQFLHYYEEADAEKFAGREKEILDIADGILHAPTLIVYGKSGLGKTSLLLAGVFPELRRRGCLPVHIRTLENPIGDLFREVSKHLADGESRSTRSGAQVEATELVAQLKRLSETRIVVLVLDQFEEFFIRFRGQRAAYDSFIAAVGAIATDRELNVHVVFSLREEYLADLDDFRANLPALLENEYRLRPLTAFGVRQTITRPLLLANIPYDPRLIAKLVDRLAKERFDSVMLQILCQEVFEHAAKRDSAEFRLTEDDLRQAGDIDLIFRRYLDQATQALPKERHLHARVVLRSLTTLERTKQALRLQNFTESLYRLSQDEVLAVLDMLRSHRLLRVDVRGGESWYELTHERLVPILEDWLRLDPEFNALLAAYDMVATPSRSGVWRNSPENLLPDEYLDVIDPFRERLVLSERELELLVQSAIYQRHRRVKFWCQQFGTDRTRKLILEKLEADNDRFRRGAAFTAARVGRGDEATRTRLFEVALTDASPEVRREAGLALAEIGNPETDASLASALREAKTRKQALETLADLCAAGSLLRGFRRFDLWRARRIARARRLNEQRLLLNDASRDGATGAVHGAVVWTVSVAFAYSLILGPYLDGVSGSDSDGKLLSIAICLGIALFSAIALGALLSLFVARSIATTFLLTRREHVTRALLRSKAFLTLPAIWVAGISTIFLWKVSDGSWDSDDTKVGCIVTLLPPIYWIFVAVAARVAQLAIRPNERWSVALRKVLLGAAGAPVLVPGLIAIAAFRAREHADGYQRDLALGFGYISLTAIPLASGLTACFGAAAARIALLHGSALTGGTEPDPRATGRRVGGATAASIVLAVAALVVAFSQVGLRVVPWPFQSDGTLTRENKQLTIRGPARPPARDIPAVEYHHFRLELERGSEQAIVSIKGTSCGYAGYGFRLDGKRLDASVVLLDVGKHEVLFSTSGGFDDCQVDVELLEPVPKSESGHLAPRGTVLLDWKKLDAKTPSTEATYEAILTGKDPGEKLVRVRIGPVLFVDLDPESSLGANAACRGDPGSGVDLKIQEYRDFGVLDGSGAAVICTAKVNEKGEWRIDLDLTVSARALVPLIDKLRAMARVRSLAKRLDVLGVELEKGVLSDIDLSKRDLTSFMLRGRDLSRTQFRNATLKDADLTDSTLSAADLAGARLTQAMLVNATLDFTRLNGAELSGARFVGTKLRFADLAGATVDSDVLLPPADFTDADLSDADLSGIVRSRPDARLSFKRAKLVRANMTGLRLVNVDLEGADLTDANLTNATLEGAGGLTFAQVEKACGLGSRQFEGRPLTLRPCDSTRYALTGTPPLAACTDKPHFAGPDATAESACPQSAPGPDTAIRGGQATWRLSNDLGVSRTCTCALSAKFLNRFVSGENHE